MRSPANVAEQAPRTTDEASRAHGGTSGAWRLVAAREIGTKLRDRTFVISFVVTLLIVAGGVGVSAFLSGREQTVDVVTTGDAAQLVAAAGELAAGVDVELDVTQVPDADAAEALLAEGEAEIAVLPSDPGWEVVGDESVDVLVTQLVRQAASDALLVDAAERAGTTPEELLAGAQVAERVLRGESADDEGAQALLGFLFAILFLLAAMTFGFTIAQSVVEEKQSRVVEILAAVVPVRALLTGKVLGNAALALGQVVSLVLVGAVGLALTGQRGLLDALARSGGWFVVFFILGFLALACLWAVAGSVATRQEDLQSTTLPIQAVLFAVYFGAFLAGDGVQRIASFVPIASSIAMPTRLLAGDVPLWEPVVSAGVTAAAAALLVLLGARLYEGSLLRTDRRTSLREAFSGSR